MTMPVAEAAPVREDAELVSAARRGDEAAFADIHARYAPMLEAYCARLLGCADDAQDAVQQTFLKAHQSLQANGNGIVLGPWLYTIARNESFTMLRARQRRPSIPLELDAATPAPGGTVELAEAREELRQTLDDIRSLPTEQREALVQTTLDSAAGAEVAETLGCEPAKVKSLVFRARSYLSDLREARELSCAEVKQQITEGSGGVLRQRVIREHLRRCESCAELADRPRFRRKLAALPVVLWPILTGRSLGVGGPVESAAASSGAEAASGIGAKAVTLAIAAVAAAGGVAANRAAVSQEAPQPPDRSRAVDRAPATPERAAGVFTRDGGGALALGAAAASDGESAGSPPDPRRGLTAPGPARTEASSSNRAPARELRGDAPPPPAAPSGPTDGGGPPGTPEGSPPPAAASGSGASPNGSGTAAETPGAAGKSQGNGAAKSEPPAAESAPPASVAPPGQAKGKNNSASSRHQRSTASTPPAEAPADDADGVEPAAEEKTKEPTPGHVKNGKASPASE